MKENSKLWLYNNIYIYIILGKCMKVYISKFHLHIRMYNNVVDWSGLDQSIRETAIIRLKLFEHSFVW